jgi:hypothetical protein
LASSALSRFFIVSRSWRCQTPRTREISVPVLPWSGPGPSTSFYPSKLTASKRRAGIASYAAIFTTATAVPVYPPGMFTLPIAP